MFMHLTTNPRKAGRITRQTLRISGRSRFWTSCFLGDPLCKMWGKTPKGRVQIDSRTSQGCFTYKVVPIEGRLEQHIEGLAMPPKPALYLRGCRTTLGVRICCDFKRDYDMV